MMEEYNAKADEEVEKAIRGTHTLTKTEAYELSQPGITTTLASEAGNVLDMPIEYMMGKDTGGFAGMGSELYGKAINR
jgi:hypothetical protein